MVSRDIENIMREGKKVNVKSFVNINELIKEKGLGGRLFVLFQPHLPTRLRDLWEEFKTRSTIVLPISSMGTTLKS